MIDSRESENEDFVQSHTSFERLILFKKLYDVSVIQLLSSISVFIITAYAYTLDKIPELLLQSIVIIIVVLCSILNIFWTRNVKNSNLQDPDEILTQEHPSLGYFHTLLSQCSLAALLAGTFTLISFIQFSDYKLIIAFQIILLIILASSTVIGSILTQSMAGTKRFTIYITVLFSLILILISGIYLKQVFYQVNLQLYSIRDIILNLVKLQLIAITAFLIIAVIVNQRRLKILFRPTGFILLVILSVSIFINGQLTREVQTAQDILDTNSGCRDTMQIISEKTLLQLEYSPFPPCPVQQQSYMWENDLTIENPQLRLNSLACLNMDCCQNISKRIIKDIQTLVYCLNLVIALTFIVSYNMLVLSRHFFKIHEQRIKGDLFILLAVSLITILLISLIYNYVPQTKWNLQKQIIQTNQKSDQVISLKQPNYSQFHLQNQNNLIDIPQYQTVLLKNALEESGYGSIDTQKQMKNPDDTYTNGIRIAIQVIGANIQFNQHCNSKNLQIINDPDILQKIFTKNNNNQKVTYDQIVFQGLNSEVQKFIDKCLFVASQQLQQNLPNLNFIIADQCINFQVEKSSRGLLSISNTIQVVQDSKPSDRNIDLDQIDFNTFEIEALDLHTQNKLNDIQVDLYDNIFQSAIQELEQRQYNIRIKQDSNGKLFLRNLYLSSYSAVITKNGYKSGLISITEEHENGFKFIVNLSPDDLPQHSMRVLLEWQGSYDFDLFVKFSAEKGECISSIMTKQCGDMKFVNSNNQILKSQYITINKIYPYDYIFYISRTLTKEQVQNLLGKTDKNKDLQLRLTVYLPELNLPYGQYFPSSIYLTYYIKKKNYFTKNKKAFHNEQQLATIWIPFCLHGAKEDKTILTVHNMQQTKDIFYQVTNQDIENFKGNLKQSWPTVEGQCF